MPVFRQRIKKKIKDFEVLVYDIDSNTENNEKLETYLVSKIKNIKILNNLPAYKEYLNVPNLDAGYIAKLQSHIYEIVNPKEHPIKHFDVRRSFLTEFLSQLLLERQYNCVFHSQADKRLNVDPVNVEKHSAGIDVTGIQLEGHVLKFAVCEVKASKSKIPCTETESLLTDIKNSMDLDKKRLTREILSYIDKLVKHDDDVIFKNIVQFLLDLLHKKDDKNHVLSNVIFFPFLLRRNDDILVKQDVSDYELFAEEKFAGSTITGVIWSFNEDIDSFCTTIWEKALKEVV